MRSTQVIPALILNLAAAATITLPAAMAMPLPAASTPSTPTTPIPADYAVETPQQRMERGQRELDADAQADALQAMQTEMAIQQYDLEQQRLALQQEEIRNDTARAWGAAEAFPGSPANP